MRLATGFVGIYIQDKMVGLGLKILLLLLAIFHALSNDLCNEVNEGTCQNAEGGVDGILVEYLAWKTYKNKIITQLFDLARGGFVEDLNSLLFTWQSHSEFLSMVNYQNSSNGDWSALHVLAYNGDEECAKLLLNYGARLNSRDADLRTPLHIASATNNIDVLEVFLNEDSTKALVEASDKFGATAIHYAANSGKSEGLAILIRSDANIEAKDFGSATIAHILAEEGFSHLLTLLVSHGINLNAEDILHKTPCHYAAANGHLNVIKVLAKHGALMAMKDFEQNTPAKIAENNGHQTSAKFLSMYKN